ncbi:hypothetical protein NPIL_428491, partial [Nephila pilipes]
MDKSHQDLSPTPIPPSELVLVSRIRIEK